MSTILVTGCLGFIGSHFVKYILENTHYNIIGISRNSDQKNLHRLDEIWNYANPDKVNKVDIVRNPLVTDRFKQVFADISDNSDISGISEDVEYIVNFAAKTFVDHSIRDPAPFIQSNIVGTYNLLEEARRNYIINKTLKRFIQVSCYDENTRALTTQGLKNYKELKEGELVFSLNPNTLEIEIKPIKKVIIQHYEGPMVHFKNKRVDLLVTPNHNMFILDSIKKLSIESANESSKRSIFYMPKGTWKGKIEEFYEIGGFWKVDIKDLMYILGVYIGDGFTSYQEKEKITKKGTRSICHAYRIFFDIPTTKKCRKRVEETLTRMQIFWHPHFGMAGEHIYFSGKEWMEFFDQCGKGAENKRIPKWVLEYSPDILKYLFEGLIGSDGSLEGEIFAENSRKIYHTSSVGLLSDISELCIKLGYDPSIHNRNIMEKEIYIQDWYNESRKIIPTGYSYYIYIANTIKSISASKKHEIIDYNGDIWCLQVEDNKNFIVERNGKFDFCGNTDEVYGSILEGAYKEDARLCPTNPYSASKAAGDMLALSYYNTYNLPIIITRTENNFGEYQHPQKAMPKFVKYALENRKLPVYGDGEHRRMWLYVKDHCSAIHHLLNHGKIGEIYHIAGEQELTNNQLAKKILNTLGKPENMIEYIDDFNIRPGHDRRYALNTEKLKSTAWQPSYKLDETLEKVVTWYKENQWWLR